MDKPSDLKENPAIGVAGLDEENGGKQFSNWIVPPRSEGVNKELRRGEALAAAYKFILSDAWGKP